MAQGRGQPFGHVLGSCRQDRPAKVLIAKKLVQLKLAEYGHQVFGFVVV